MYQIKIDKHLLNRLEPNEDLKVFVQEKTESDLLKKLKSIVVETDEAKEASEVAGATAPKNDLAALFGAMKVFIYEFLFGQIVAKNVCYFKKCLSVHTI